MLTRRDFAALSVAAAATPLTGAIGRRADSLPSEQGSFRGSEVGGVPHMLEVARVPAIAYALVERGRIVRSEARGSNRAGGPEVTRNTYFDAASLTKVVATTPAIMLLVEQGKIVLDSPVHAYIEEFRREGKEAITVRHLMTHTSGLRAGLSPAPAGTQSAIQMACQEKLANPVGTKFLYSDINYILLGEIIHRVSGRPLEVFVADEIFARLEMKDTRYLPLPEQRARIAPTEREGTNLLRGVVHDPTARRMDRVAGHAGVFTTAADLARFARMMLNEGELDDVRLFKPETVRLMTSVQSPAGVNGRRGLGWDIDTGYSTPRGNVFPIGSYGHTGFTGTAMWIDPFSKTFVILLTNSVHPNRKGDVRGLRRAVGTLAAEAVRDFDFNHVPGALPGTNQMSSVR